VPSSKLAVARWVNEDASSKGRPLSPMTPASRR
jgi:hypothetical protein